MTFIEAAIEVLRREGRPLHYDKITELVLKYKLLSHVGKNPEATMAARLALQVKVPRPDSIFLKVKPGVFALSEWKGVFPGPRKPTKEELEAAQRDEAEEAEKREAEAREAEAASSKEEEADDSRASKHELRQRRGQEPRQEKPRQEAKREEPRQEKPRREEPRQEKPRTSGRPPRRRPLAELAEEVLRGGEARPLGLKRLTQSVSERAGEVSTGGLAAALGVENSRRRAQGLPPLFRRDPSGAYALAEWSLSARAAELEADLHRAAKERYEELLREFGQRLIALGASPIEPLIALALERAGYTEARLVRRSSEGNLALTARAAHNLARARTLFLVRRQGAAITAKDVAELRAALPSFGAQAGVIIALTGSVEAARVEAGALASTTPLAPVAIWDERGLASLLVEAGVGVATSVAPSYALDAGLFSELEAE